MRVPKGYSRNPPCTLNLIHVVFLITITISSGELLVPAGIIRPVVPVPSQDSERSWMCFRYYLFLQLFLELFRHCGIFYFLLTAVFCNSFNVFDYWKFEANRILEFIVAFNTLGILFQLRW